MIELGHKKSKNFYLMAILISIGILYLLFIYIDNLKIGYINTSNILKYTSIILCFLITLMVGKDNINNNDITLLQAGLFITTFADLAFVIFEYYNVGIILFSYVQIIYYIRFKVNKSNIKIYKFIGIFLIILLFYFLLDFINKPIDIIYILGFFYAICITMTTIEAIKAYRYNLYPEPNKYLMVCGILFFLFGDINVGLAYLLKGSSTSFYNISIQLIWVFYLPSQVLLSLSGYNFAKGPEDKIIL